MLACSDQCRVRKIVRATAYATAATSAHGMRRRSALCLSRTFKHIFRTFFALSVNEHMHETHLSTASSHTAPGVRNAMRMP